VTAAGSVTLTFDLHFTISVFGCFLCIMFLINYDNALSTIDVIVFRVLNVHIKSHYDINYSLTLFVPIRYHAVYRYDGFVEEVFSTISHIGICSEL